MKLLIITQKVDKNDSILGFFHRWIEEFAKNFESIVVICLEKGVHCLPNNVEVYSLGKEEKKSRLQYLFRFYKYIWKLQDEYDAVFVHMNPLYIVLGGLGWKIFGKKIGLWYTHKNVDIKLKMAELIVDFIFSASKESFRLYSKKLVITGHGIDTQDFVPNNEHKNREILTVGRITSSKNIHMMVDIVECLENVQLRIIGGPVMKSDNVYMSELKKVIKNRQLVDRIIFEGEILQSGLPHFYNNASVFLNMSNTGSLDKAVLEALAMGVPVVTTNEAFSSEQFGTLSIFAKNDVGVITQRIKEILEWDGAALSSYSEKSRNIVIKFHSLDTLAKKIRNQFE